MGLFEKFKKPVTPERINGAALLFCPESDPRKVMHQVEELFQIEHVGDQNNITL